MKKSILLLSAFCLVCCQKINVPEPAPTPDPIYQNPPTATMKPRSIPALEELTLHQKVCQLFFLRPEALEGTTTQMCMLTDKMKATFRDYPVGGFTLFAGNITTPFQCAPFTDDLHDLGFYPLLSIDEEGGTVARIGRNTSFNVPRIGSAYDIGITGDSLKAYNAGKTIGEYLLANGFDIDFAPVADVWTNPQNTVIGKRAFSTDAYTAASMSSEFLMGLQSEKIQGCLKHFPGHGDTSTDTHYGYATTGKYWDELLECEMIPFKRGISKGAKIIMTAHVSAPNVTHTDLPSTLSEVMLTDKLRGELGFEGIIVTDAIEMGAISKQFSIESAAVMAVQAGADIVLIPNDFKAGIAAIEAAVAAGEITEERIDESVARILDLKRSILESRGLLVK